MTAPLLSPSPRAAWLPWAIVAAYAAVRLALLPSGDLSLGGFTHDSAYIILVAQNLMEGRGYVNDAHWLVFLDPPELPIPFHNANPLYPTLIGGVSLVTGLDPVAAGFAVSALSGVGVLAALLWLVGHYTPSPALRVALALPAALFAPAFEGSLELLPDELTLALSLAGLASLVRAARPGHAVLAGVFLGLAWLTRSSALMVLPAAAVYLLLAHGWRAGTWRVTLAGAAWLVTAAPWLVHTAAVWGDPFRSDAPYYLLQDYHAREFGGSLNRYWHSTREPPSVGELLRREPGELLAFAARCVPHFLRQTAAGWSYGSYPLLGLLAALGGYALWRGAAALAADPALRQRFRPELVAVPLLLLTALAMFALRADSFEKRYLALPAALFALLLAGGAVMAWHEVRTARGLRRGAGAIALGLSAALWLAETPYRDVQLWRERASASAERAAYFATARQFRPDAGPVVVGTFPYYYTLVTGIPSLSIPESDDDYLRRTMARHGARFVVMTPEDANFWRPDWLTPSGLPGWLERRDGPRGLLVFERKEPR